MSKENDGLPYLSRKDLDQLGEKYVAEFCPEALKEPMPLDIDKFVAFFLGMNQDYQWLSHNGVYLGLTVFNDTDLLPVYDPELNEAKYVSEKARTVVIDNRLLEADQEHRYRFTMGHEAGHGILHAGLYMNDPNQEDLFVARTEPIIKCRVDAFIKFKSNRMWTSNDWIEWQANQFSSAFLMPHSMIMKLISGSHASTRDKAFDAAMRIRSVSEIFNVSKQAAKIRLENLGLIDAYPLHEIIYQMSFVG